MRYKLVRFLPKITLNVLNIDSISKERFELDVSEAVGFTQEVSLGTDLAGVGLLGLVMVDRLLNRIDSIYAEVVPKPRNICI